MHYSIDASPCLCCGRCVIVITLVIVVVVVIIVVIIVVPVVVFVVIYVIVMNILSFCGGNSYADFARIPMRYLFQHKVNRRIDTCTDKQRWKLGW